MLVREELSMPPSSSTGVADASHTHLFVLQGRC